MATTSITPAPANGSRTPVRWADDETLRVVRPEVRKILESSDAFRKMEPADQRQLAGTMVKVCSYMTNPDGLAAQELHPERGGVLALGGPVEDTKKRLLEDTKRLSEKPGSTGAEFQAGAVRQGVEEFGELVKKVDFPKFVSGLIQGVFQAIVDSTIQQMHAYGELLANVAKTVDQFAQDNISSNNARDWLAQKFPESLSISTEGMDSEFAEGDQPAPPQPKLVATGEDPTAALQSISTELQLAKAITDLSDPNEETRLVMAARLQMARGRQQLLASMVLLGINRIVVTDGLIHAKVVFDMKASDKQKRRARASLYDSDETKTASQLNVSYGGWFSPVSADGSFSTSSDHLTTVQSSVDDSSESKAEVKAKLTGEVRVNFKSDYLPMDKMATPQMIAAIQGNAVPPEKTPGVPPGTPGTAAPAKA